MNTMLPRRQFLTTTALGAGALLLPRPLLRAAPYAVGVCVFVFAGAFLYFGMLPLLKKLRDQPPKKDDDAKLFDLSALPEDDENVAMECPHEKTPCPCDGSSDFTTVFDPEPVPQTFRLTGRLEWRDGQPFLGPLVVRQRTPAELVSVAEHDRLLRLMGLAPSFRGASYGRNGQPIDATQSPIRFMPHPVGGPGTYPGVTIAHEGWPSAQVILESSTDLKEWRPLSTITTTFRPTGQNLIFSHQPNDPRLSYRLRLVA